MLYRYAVASTTYRLRAFDFPGGGETVPVNFYGDVRLRFVRSGEARRGSFDDARAVSGERAFVPHGRTFYPMLTTRPAFRVNFRPRRR